MENNRTVLICDADYAAVNAIEKHLENEGFNVDTIDRAIDLIPTAIRLQPHVIIVNPDMEGFTDTDVCKHIIKEQGSDVILLVDAHSSTRSQLGDCLVEDVVTKPVNLENLVNLVLKNVTFHQ